ncbi:MAG: peptidylprolyl isomerase [Gammaproteobacteria bacterium]|nr:peptidyl-prolyl cis-trans isomerase [Pseudomonadales bacterium]MCP5346614.1 peptidyl-prolyl cis-trans isomerase [Pseudomonadales bacterium]
MQLRILREPTFHFLALAAGISLFYWLFNNDDSRPLQIDWQEVEARIVVTELAQGYPATDEQKQEIENLLIDDYVLVMEAYDMGLQNDARINDILTQKMRHVLSGNVIQPTDDELQAFYQQNLDRYGQPARVTATELVFNNPDPLPAEVAGQLAAGVPEQDLVTDLNRIAGILPRVTQEDLASIFDTETASGVFTSSGDDWVGPYISRRGQHWIQVEQRFPARTPPLDEIIEQVRLDWIAREEEQRLQQEIERLRNRYAISIVNRPA